MAERWATFDCYGTLIDWDGGIRRELARLFGEERAGEQLARYHQVEPEIQRAEPSLSYREVMARVLDELGAPAGEREALGDSLPSWAPFPEVQAALTEARGRGRRPAADARALRLGGAAGCARRAGPGVSFEFREPTEQDVHAVAALCNAFERAVAEEPEIGSVEDLLRWWRRELERRLVLDGEELVGYAHLQRRGERWDGDGYVHPNAVGRGVGTALAE